jgi:hypothetical protein
MKRIVAEITDVSAFRTETLFEVDEKETVGSILKRSGITGQKDWHYDRAEIVIKLMKES